MDSAPANKSMREGPTGQVRRVGAKSAPDLSPYLASVRTNRERPVDRERPDEPGPDEQPGPRKPALRG